MCLHTSSSGSWRASEVRSVRTEFEHGTNTRDVAVMTKKEFGYLVAENMANHNQH